MIGMRRIMQLLTRGALAAVALATAVPVSAQQTGSISGRVLTSVGQQPVAAAQVTVVGATAGPAQGALTDAEGNFQIIGVPAGRVQLRVRRIGYTPTETSVTVTDGARATVTISLEAAVISLDEVVITATGESQRRRETGNSVNTVQPSTERLATSTNVAQVLQAQAPGVSISSSGGTSGSAPRIRIRGINSVSLSNEPLLIIDGVRASNEIGGTGTTGVGGQTPSRLNDINPDDIASIDIIKGPAAAALYGTAASNGVIQIRTKRGEAGKTQWRAFVEGGSQEDTYDYPSNFTQVGNRPGPDGARLTGCTLDAQARNVCIANPDSLVSFNPLRDASPFQTGTRTSFGLSAAGGGAAATYFISGDADRDNGVYEPNTFRRTSLRANVTSQLRENLDVAISSAYISSRLKFPQNDNNILGIISGAILGSAFDNPTSRGYIAGQTPQELFAIDTRENVERFIGSATANLQITNWLSGIGTAGVDYLNRRNLETVPPNRVNFGSLPEGNRTANAASLWNYTANGGLTAEYGLGTELSASSSAGMQFTSELVQGTRAFGAQLLAGTGSLQGAAARFSVGETNTENRTLGAYFQQQLSWQDRLFLTGALRTDNNSAFGENFGFVTYPAASVSYVVSESGFFPQNTILNSLRLRAAYGKSGQRPNFRDAITFFNAQTVTVGTVDQPGITVGGTGNIDLRPEVSSELDFGIESQLLNGRLNMDVGYYTKRTDDLLIARPLPPSLGLTGNQFANLGESSNQGWEFLVNANVGDVQRALFEVTMTGSTSRNRLDELGTLPNGDSIPPIVIGRQRHTPGYPLGGYWDRKVTFDDKNDDGILTRVNCPGQTQIADGPECEVFVAAEAEYLGTPFPTREFSISPRVHLFGWLQMSALVDYKGGHKLYNNTGRFQCSFGNCEAAYNPETELFLQARNLGQAMGTDAGYVEDADYTKLREVAVTFLAPQTLASRFRTSGLSLTLAGRNLATWTDYTGFDPEVNSTPGANFSTSDFLTQPPLRLFSARLSVSF